VWRKQLLAGVDIVRNLLRLAVVIWILLGLALSPAWARGGGGCFLAGTSVLLADGSEKPIQELSPGQAVLAVGDDGRLVHATLLKVFVHQEDAYLKVRVGQDWLCVTREHPFLAADGSFKAIGEWKPGDLATVCRDGVLTREPVAQITQVPGLVKVFNLSVDGPNTYFAGHVAVHNKGGGCFPAGTMIKTPGGEKAIEQILPGETAIAIDHDGSPVKAPVTHVYQRRSALLKVTTDAGVLNTTDEHPLLTADGAFAQAGMLKAGDRVMVFRDETLLPATITATEAGEHAQVYNLTVDGPHTYIADGFVVHNKGGGGCFPAGTGVATPQGSRPIQSLTPGDTVLAVGTDQRPVPVKVRKVFVQQSELLTVHTSAGNLVTTHEHPLALADGGFTPAGNLQPGQMILAWAQDQARPASVTGLSRGTQMHVVYNLEVDGPHTYIAGGFIVHNKGGGFSRGGRSFSSSGWGRSRSSYASTQPSSFDDPWCGITLLLGVVAVFGLLIYLSKRQQAQGHGVLDILLSIRQVEPRARRAAQSLARIARTDPGFEPRILDLAARNAFSKLQECWQNRNYRPMQPLMMSELYNQHTAQLAGMIRSNEINMVDVKSIDSIDIVQVRYGKSRDNREFTALITATAADFFVDARTNNLIRGSRTPAQFQEFWTFQQSARDGAWLLREIQQTRESDVLREGDDLSGLPDQPGSSELANLPSHKAIGESNRQTSRLETLMEELENKDPAWRKRNIISAAQEAFTLVYMARQSGKPEDLNPNLLTQELIDKEREQMTQRAQRGDSLEYRNFCVRRVQIVLAFPTARAKSRDGLPEVTARVIAHAIKVLSSNGTPIQQDQDIMAFSEMCELVLEAGNWKLKSITLSM
jgi:predicted lipid-binding transport protein (Tim44 family)